MLLFTEMANDLHQLKLAVGNNKDQLTSGLSVLLHFLLLVITSYVTNWCLCSVTKTLKKLSVIDSLSKSVAAIKCTIKLILNNSMFTHIWPYQENAHLHTAHICVSVCTNQVQMQETVVLWVGLGLSPAVTSSAVSLSPGTNPETGVKHSKPI